MRADKVLNFLLLICIFFTFIAVYMYGQTGAADILQAKYIVIGVLGCIGSLTAKVFYSYRDYPFFGSMKCVAFSGFVVASSSVALWYYPQSYIFMFIKFLGIAFFVIGMLVKVKSR